MKAKILISLAIVSIAMITLTFSCSSDVQENEEFSFNSLNTIELNEGIFDEPTPFGDNIYLPKGTHWHYTNEMQNEIVFELPKEYVFLMKNIETGKHEIFSQIAGYSCTCSEGGCTVFHTKQLGYGCLQGSCTGTSRTTISPNLQIAGVLNAKNNELDTNLKQERASLSNQGIKGFFELKEVQEEIIAGYNLFYNLIKHEIPDFESEIYDTEKFVYMKSVIYGVEIDMIVPRNIIMDIQETFPDMNLQISNLLSFDTPSSCGCSGESQGGNCKLEKASFLGTKVYYCSGCTTCTMD